MKAFIVKYQAIIAAVLAVLATLATLTQTKVDDTLVASASSFVQEQVVTPTTVVPAAQ